MCEFCNVFRTNLFNVDAEQDDRDDGAECRDELSEIKGDAKKPFIPNFDISGVSLVKVPQICRQVTQKCIEWVEARGNKFPGAQPVSMTRENIKFLPFGILKIDLAFDVSARIGQDSNPYIGISVENPCKVSKEVHGLVES